MTINIPNIANELNKLASAHPIGKLQEIRKKLKGLKRRPGNKIFSVQTTNKAWAFHHGGRKELQFNIGEDGENGDVLRHGVAFSFELSQTLTTTDVLVPKVKLFNDFIELNADNYSDMRMWHYNPKRSSVYPVGKIPVTLVENGVFVFLGKLHSSNIIDYKNILDDFDRLLALYQYVESAGTTAPLPLLKNDFTFKPGHSKKLTTARFTLTEKELDLDLRHNLLQEALYYQLTLKYGKDAVRTEQPSGVGTLIDMVVKIKNEYWFYEIKTALTPRACLRAAIGQLLEYGYWPGAKEPTRLIVIGENPIDQDAQEYIYRLSKQFSLPIEYEAIVI